MKKIIYCGMMACLIMGLLGCGEAVRETGKYTISGSVWTYDYTKSPSYTDYNDYYKTAVPSVNVLLQSPTNTFTVVADNAGKFIINNVPFANYTMIMTKEGYAVYPTTLSIDTAAYPPGSRIELNYIMDPRPYITKVVAVGVGAITSFETVVPSTVTSFEFYFSQTMETASVTPVLNEASMRASSVNAQGVVDGITQSWDAAKKVLTITCAYALKPDMNYYLGLTNINKSSYYYMRDVKGNYFYYNNSSGNACPLFTYTTSDSTYGTYIYVALKTATDKSAVPAKPTGLVVRQPYVTTTEVDYDDVYSSGSSLNLSWTGDSNAVGYRLYASYAGGPYQAVQSSTTASLLVTPSSIDSALAEYSRIGAGSSPIYPGLPWPFLGVGISLEVSAYNAFGESALSDPVLVKDNVRPTFGSVTETSDTVKVFYFSEPLEQTAAENVSNYSITGGTPADQTVVSATLQNDFSVYSSTYVRLVLSPGTASGTLNVSNVADLSGNIINTTKSF